MRANIAHWYAENACTEADASENARTGICFMTMIVVFRTGMVCLPVLSLILLLSPLSARASASPDKSVTLFENEGLVPSSTAAWQGGGLILTVNPAPVVVGINAEGKIAWRFDERREPGIDTNLKATVPQADGSVIVCANRESLPGRHYEQYPAYIFKLDRNGHEVARFDPLKRPQSEWPYLRLTSCVPWGDDFLLVAKPPPSIATAMIKDGDQERGQAMAVRMHGDLSVVWNHLIPTGGLGLPRMRSHAIDKEHLILVENDTLIGLKADGSVYGWQAVHGCLLVSPIGDAGQIRIICQEPSHPGTPWELREIDNHLHVTRHLFLQNATGKYPGMTSACALPGDRFAVIAKRDYYSDLLIFDLSGQLLKTVSLPARIELKRSGVEIHDIFAQDNGVVGVALTIKEFLQYGSSSINWVRLPVN
jgi:hypothetical protein